MKNISLCAPMRSNFNIIKINFCWLNSGREYENMYSEMEKNRPEWAQFAISSLIDIFKEYYFTRNLCFNNFYHLATKHPFI